MLNYEMCVILNAQLPDTGIDAFIDKAKGILDAGGAKILEVSRWGKRHLAYEIDKATDGFYVIFYFNLERPGDTLKNLERLCKYDDNVLREVIFNVPTKKKKQEIKQIVPSPGWMSEFSMRLRPHTPRRREGYGRGPRQHDTHREEAPAPVQVQEAPPAPVEAAAAEEKE